MGNSWVCEKIEQAIDKLLSLPQHVHAMGNGISIRFVTPDNQLDGGEVIDLCYTSMLMDDMFEYLDPTFINHPALEQSITVIRERLNIQ